MPKGYLKETSESGETVFVNVLTKEKVGCYCTKYKKDFLLVLL